MHGGTVAKRDSILNCFYSASLNLIKLSVLEYVDKKYWNVPAMRHYKKFSLIFPLLGW